MKIKSPQEKKELSYAKDRRNSYGANDKASRKSIPKRKALVNKAYRQEANAVLKQAERIVDVEHVLDVGDAVRSVGRSEWKKSPDAPLGEVVKTKLQNRVDHAGHGKTERKAEREFSESLKVEVENVGSKWVARASEYPHLVAYADRKNRAEEKLRHIAGVAKRNDLGANIRVLIDESLLLQRCCNKKIHPRITEAAGASVKLENL